MSTTSLPRQYILCGGGLDTMATLAWLSKSWNEPGYEHVLSHKYRHSYGPLRHVLHPEQSKTILVSIDYGQVAADQEFKAVEVANQQYLENFSLLHVRVEDDMGLIRHWNNGKGKLFGTEGEAKLVGRNLALAIIAFNRLGLADTLMYCLTLENDVPMPEDTKPRFLHNLSSVLDYSDMFGQVVAPLSQVRKDYALELGLSYWPRLFEIAFSCWTPIGGLACGECRHCQRLMLFQNMLTKDLNNVVTSDR